MVHGAYDAKELVKACPVKIESVALWKLRLFVSCIDGSLRIYARSSPNPSGYDGDEDESSSTSSISSPSISMSDTFTLQTTVIGFAKKPVTDIHVWQSKDLLICLADAVIVHNLPTFDVMSYLTSTRGASIYAWDEKQGLLCAAKQKKLIIFQYDGNREFYELKELTAPDAVKSMAWSGESLCLGIRREYVIINTISGVLIELFPCGRVASPLVVPLPNGELLLGKDNVGVFIDQNGKLTNPGGLTWSEVPTTVVISPPYAVAWLPRFIEVRNLKSHALVQMIPLREMQLLPTGNHFVAIGTQVLAASDSAVHALLLVPLATQIVQLAASRNFEEALDLCKMLPIEDAALRAIREDDIHKRFGYFLFEQGDYMKSMEHFAASSLELASILSLFPTIKFPQFHTITLSENDGEFTSLRSEQFDASDNNAEFLADTGEPKNDDISDEKKLIMQMKALASFLMGKRAAIVEKAETEDTDEAVAAMVISDHSSKDLKRPKHLEQCGNKVGSKYGARELAALLDTALVQALLVSRQSDAAIKLLKGSNFCDIDSCEEMMLQGGHYMELLQLYKYNELHSKVLCLLNKLSEEKEALMIECESEEIGPGAIIDYMKKLGGHDPYLILDSSTWLLKVCAEKAMDAFSTMVPPLPVHMVNSYLKDKFPELQAMYLEHLMLNDKLHFTDSLQSELINLHLSKVLEERAELIAQGTWDERQYSEARKKLLSVLERCSGYNCESILKRLPMNSLHEERALLLGRLGQHQFALTLYAHKLHEPQLALKYCDIVYLTSMGNKSDPKSLNIYSILLQIYLRPAAAIREYDRSVAGLEVSKKFSSPRIGTAYRAKGHVARKIAQIEGADEGRQNVSSNESTTESGKSDVEDNQTNDSASERLDTSVAEGVMLEAALDLLNTRWDRIDGAQALSLLPMDTQLQRLYPFLEPLVRKSSEARRNLSVIRSLRQSENFQVHDELQCCRRRSIKIAMESMCSLCQKRIGNGVFVVYPSGTFVHFVCYKDKKVNGSYLEPHVFRVY